jgi:hypothetical protein
MDNIETQWIFSRFHLSITSIHNLQELPTIANPNLVQETLSLPQTTHPADLPLDHVNLRYNRFFINSIQRKFPDNLFKLRVFCKPSVVARKSPF